MKKVRGNKIVIILFFTMILLIIQGCNKSPIVNPDNNEVNSLLFFITRTEHGGETKISEFKRFDRDKDTIFYYIKWNYINEDDNDVIEREHLIVFNNSTYKSELYPLNYLDDYPVIKKAWNELNEKDDFKIFSRVEIEQFLVNVIKIRESIKSE